MTDSRLNALSPLDGRYADKCADLAALFSEAALIARRVRVEAAWFRQLADSGRFAALPAPSAAVDGAPRFPRPGRRRGRRRPGQGNRARDQPRRQGGRVLRARAARRRGRHGRRARVRAFRLHVRGHQQPRLRADAGRGTRAHPAARDRGGGGAPRRARGRHASLAMLSRTHGQAASPTTLGKEAANFTARLARAAESFRARRGPREVQWRGRLLQRACRRGPGARLARRVAPAHRGARAHGE